MKGTKIDVLDKGYVLLEDYMGTDLTPVNAARASFRKKSPELTERDKKLIRFLGSHGHTSPFRHAMLQFEVRAPIIVCRQWWKYVVGSTHGPNSDDIDDIDMFLDALMGQEGEGQDTTWNETSGRYVTQDWEFHVPLVWRSAPEDRKQGSGPPLPQEIQNELTDWLRDDIRQGLARYEGALARGAAAEQARGFLNYAFMYTNWYWTASLQAVSWFLIQRHPAFIGEHAQVEIQEYADAVWRLVKPIFPESLEALTKPYES